MIVLIHTFHQQPVQSVFPTRIPGDHPAARRHPASPPQIKKKVWTRLSYRRRSLFVSAEVERMAHWSAYGSRVFSSPGSIFARLIHSAFTMTHRRGIEPRSIIGETRVYYWSVVRSSYLSFPRVREPGRLSEPALYRSFLEIHYSPPRDCGRSLTRPQTTRLEIRPY